MGFPAPVPGFSALLGAYGKAFGESAMAPSEWEHEPTVTAVIPALNEERTIAYAISSLDAQTVTPDKLIIIDDGSTDATRAVINDVSERVSFPITVVTHEEPRGKTPSIKEVAREATADLLFVLDADTYLESDDYLEQVRKPHADSNVACTFGRVGPITGSAKQAFYQNVVSPRTPKESVTDVIVDRNVDSKSDGTLDYWLTRWPVEQYRATLYDIEQGFTKDASMRLYGTALFPAGCGVLYDRTELVNVFDRYESSLGDDLTNSEDIFLGYAFVDNGLSNIQVSNVKMRTTEPSIRKFVSQLYLWSSANLQSAYYFRQSLVRLRHSKSTDEDEQVRPPIGRTILAQLLDGLFPIGLIILTALVALHLASLEWLALLLLVEYTLYTAIATIYSQHRLKSLWRSLLSAPIRFLALPISAYTYARVGSDIIRGNRNWRK